MMRQDGNPKKDTEFNIVDDKLNHSGDFSNEKIIETNNLGKEINTSKTKEYNDSGEEFNSNKTRKKSKTTSTLTTILLVGAVTGTTIIGAAVMSKALSVDVSLFSANSVYLTFKIDVKNRGDNHLKAILSNGDWESFLEIEDYKFYKFSDLYENTTYTPSIYDENAKNIYEKSFSTLSEYVDYGYIVVEEYGFEGLVGHIENFTSFPFTTIKIFQEGTNPIYVQDVFESFGKFYLKEFDPTKYGYITLTYKDIGIDVYECEILPPPPQYSVSLINSNISFNSINYEFKVSSKDYLGDMTAYFDGSVIPITNSETEDDVFSVAVDSLDPETDHYIEITDSNGNLLYNDNFQTDFAAKLEVNSSTLELSFSESYIDFLYGDSHIDNFVYIYDGFGNMVHYSEAPTIYTDTITLDASNFYDGEFVVSVSYVNPDTMLELAIFDSSAQFGAKAPLVFDISFADGVLNLSYVSGYYDSAVNYSFNVFCYATGYSYQFDYLLDSVNSIHLDTKGVNGAGMESLTLDSGTYTLDISLSTNIVYTHSFEI